MLSYERGMGLVFLVCSRKYESSWWDSFENQEFYRVSTYSGYLPLPCSVWTVSTHFRYPSIPTQRHNDVPTFKRLLTLTYTAINII